MPIRCCCRVPWRRSHARMVRRCMPICARAGQSQLRSQWPAGGHARCDRRYQPRHRHRSAAGRLYGGTAVAADARSDLGPGFRQRSCGGKTRPLERSGAALSQRARPVSGFRLRAAASRDSTRRIGPVQRGAGGAPAGGALGFHTAGIDAAAAAHACERYGRNSLQRPTNSAANSMCAVQARGPICVSHEATNLLLRAGRGRATRWSFLSRQHADSPALHWPGS